MADINVVLGELKKTVGELTVENIILRIEVSERESSVSDLNAKIASLEEELNATKKEDPIIHHSI